MTPAQRAARERAAQGLNDRIIDPAVLAKIAALLAAEPAHKKKEAA